MTLPNAALALVEMSKITQYLLNAAHPDNGGKAAFFVALGFEAADPQILADAFRELALTTTVTSSVQSVHGHKYVLDAPLRGPSGATRGVRTVWIVDRGSDAPRLVTAYPSPVTEAP